MNIKKVCPYFNRNKVPKPKGSDIFKDKIKKGRIMKYRKKPVIVEAIQVLPTTCTDIIKYFIGQPITRAVTAKDIEGTHNFPTVNGVEIEIGDWIIKGINGEFYPCKPDIFEKTYEKI